MNFHRPLEKNNSAYIPGDQILEILDTDLRKHVTVKEITSKLKQKNNNFNLHCDTVRRFMRKKLGLRFRKPSIHSIKLNEVNYKLHIAIHLKLFSSILNRGFTVCWFDESKIELRNHKFKVWCGTQLRKYNFQPSSRSSTNLLLAVTSKGFLHWDYTSENIDTNKFKSIFDDLLDSTDEQEAKEFVYYLDNAPAHHCKKTRNWLKKKDIRVFFGAPYMSNLNLAEYIFKIIKRNLYKEYFTNM